MNKLNTSIRTGVFASFLSLLLVGCATSIDRPVEQLTRAQSSIDMAKDQHQSAINGINLQKAEANLAAARAAANKGNNLEATHLAEQAEVEAELAAAIANRRNTEQSLEEIQETIRTLKEETIQNMQ